MTILQKLIDIFNDGKSYVYKVMFICYKVAYKLVRLLPYGIKMIKMVVKSKNYILYEKNILTMIVYLVFAGIGFVIYVARGMVHYLPGPYLSNIHKYTGSIIMFICYYSYYRACTDDPGIIKNKF